MDQSDGIHFISNFIVESNARYAITTSSIILTVLIVLIPVWLYLSYKNSATKSVLFYGWFPVICAMVISRLENYSAV